MARPVSDEELPPVPRFDLHKVFELCRQLELTVGISVYHETLTGREYDVFVESVRQQLPRVSSFAAVDESCRELLNVPITVENFKQLAWRLAGNLPKLQRGDAVTRWTVQRSKEWAPAQIVRIWPAKNHYDRVGHMCNLRILSGAACPLVLQKFWSREACGVLSSRLGFSNRFGKRPYQSGLLLFGLRMCVLLEPELSRDGPMFQHIAVSSSCMKHNKSLLTARLQRIPPCPYSYTHPCYRCAVGAEECPAATHRETFVAQRCAICGKDEAIFDPEMSLQACRACFLHDRLRQ